MSYSLTQFQNNTQNNLAALDNNTATLSAQAPIPCTVAGTNVLTLTQNGAGVVPTSTISAYTQGMIFTGVAAASNTGATTARVGALPSLNVYKDTISGGAVLLAGNEIVIGCAFSLFYDATLNAGAGGFHLISNTADTGTILYPSAIQINQVGASLTNLNSGNSPTLTFTATPGWSGQNQAFTVTGVGSALPAVGDFVQVTPPSLNATGVQFTGFVQAVGSLSSVSSVATIAIQLQNSASASLASNSGIYRWLATRTVP